MGTSRYNRMDLNHAFLPMFNVQCTTEFDCLIGIACFWYKQKYSNHFGRRKFRMIARPDLIFISHFYSIFILQVSF